MLFFTFAIVILNHTAISNDTPHTLNVHSVESFGTHDGPGIRMVIFLQGCNLKCLYCHNPDTIKIQDAKTFSSEELVRRAINMKPYFGGNGGITVSGGEPLLQGKALLPFFEQLKKEGIHTNIDTNGTILLPETKQLLDKYADLVMLDIKQVEEAAYHTLTGARNIEKVLKFAQYREASGKPMWLRYVLLPGFTNQYETLHKVGQTYGHFNSIQKIEIQPYHKLGIHKWESMGWDYQLKNAKENTPEQIAEAESIFQHYFKEVKIN